MALKGKWPEIEAFRKQLIDEPTDDEWSPQPSGSVEMYDNQPDLVAPQLYMRAIATTMQPETQHDSPSQYYKEGSERTRSSMPQMTRSREEQSS